MTLRPLVATGLALAALTACKAPFEQAPRAPSHVFIVRPPIPVPAAGQTHLVYEIGIRNDGPAPLVVSSVHGSDAPLEGADLRRAMTRNAARAGSDPTVIEPHATGLVFLWETDPGPLHHTVELRGWPGPDGAHQAVADVIPDTASPLVLGPPVRGNGWRVIQGCGNDSAHRRHVHVASRKPHLAQRFALDLVREDAASRARSGPPGDPASWFAFRAKVLSACEGTVVRVVDGIPDQPVRPDQALMRTVAGNHVVVETRDGRYVFYAHLGEGTIPVAEGDEVRHGDVLGRIGNSGNATEPHLHVHVADGPDAFEAQGLPFVFARFEVVPGPARRGYGDAGTGQRRNELPLIGDLLIFPD